VPEQPIPHLPLAAQVRSRRAGRLHPACSPLAGGGSHHLSGAGLTGGMRMESHGAEARKTAGSLLPSSRPLSTARSQPERERGALQPATCRPLRVKVPSRSDYLYLVLRCRPGPGREPLGSSAKPLTAQARGHHARGRGVGHSDGRRPAAATAEMRRGGDVFSRDFAPVGGWQMAGLRGRKSCRGARSEAPRSPAWLPTGLGLAWGQEMLRQRLPPRTPRLGSDDGVTYPQVSLSLE